MLIVAPIRYPDAVVKLAPERIAKSVNDSNSVESAEKVLMSMRKVPLFTGFSTKFVRVKVF